MKNLIWKYLPNSLINSVKTPGSLSMRHQFPAMSAIFLHMSLWVSFEVSPDDAKPNQNMCTMYILK